MRDCTANLQHYSLAEKNNLQKGDMIIKMDDHPVSSISDLMQIYQSIKWMGAADCIIIRNQQKSKFILRLNKPNR